MNFVPPSPAAPPAAPATVCVFYLNGQCTKGEECAFAHDAGVAPPPNRCGVEPCSGWLGPARHSVWSQPTPSRSQAGVGPTGSQAERCSKTALFLELWRLRRWSALAECPGIFDHEPPHPPPKLASPKHSAG